MTRTKPSPRLKWTALAAAIIWLLAVGWSQAVSLDAPSVPRSSFFSSQTEECTGTVAARYGCVSERRVSAQQRNFLFWIWKLFVVFGPPLAIAIVYTFISRRVWARAEAERRRKYAERRRSAAARLTDVRSV